MNESDKKMLGAGRFLQLIDQGGWEFVQRSGVSGVVVVLAVTDEGRVVLVEQFRAPIGAPVIELPAGLAGDGAHPADEPLEEAARRELLEETGYGAREMTFLTAGPSSAGLTDEMLTMFRATGLEKVAAGGGHGDEDIQVHEIPLDEVVAWLAEKARQGVPADPKVYAGLFFAGLA